MLWQTSQTVRSPEPTRLCRSRLAADEDDGCVSPSTRGHIRHRLPNGEFRSLGVAATRLAEQSGAEFRRRSRH